MRIEPFRMERWQSLHEHDVEINLSESGVLPLSVADLLDGEDAVDLLQCGLGYPRTNGSEELRARVAAFYPHATPAHVEITNGGAEANFLALWNLLTRDDEAIVLAPVYGQVLGLARAFARRTHVPRLVRDDAAGRHRIDLDALRALVNERTRLIALCNPNNPTGARLRADELDRIGEIADRVGAWVLCDEIYRGAEIDGAETPSMWGRAERVVITSGLSKAYGLPGLRIGWVASEPARVADFWGHHDYTTIAPSAVSDLLARRALEPERRLRLIERTRARIRANLPLVADFVAAGDELAWIPPEAGAIAWIRYPAERPSSELAEMLRKERGVLIVPGDHFDTDGHLRIGFGGDADALCVGLERLQEALRW